MHKPLLSQGPRRLSHIDVLCRSNRCAGSDSSYLSQSAFLLAQCPASPSLGTQVDATKASNALLRLGATAPVLSDHRSRPRLVSNWSPCSGGKRTDVTDAVHKLLGAPSTPKSAQQPQAACGSTLVIFATFVIHREALEPSPTTFRIVRPHATCDSTQRVGRDNMSDLLHSISGLLHPETQAARTRNVVVTRCRQPECFPMSGDVQSLCQTALAYEVSGRTTGSARRRRAAGSGSGSLVN